MAQFHSLKIKSILRQTNKAVSITFEVPTSLKSEYVFTAGQYITLKAMIDGAEVRRDYSLSSSPQSESLTVTVKEIENGVFSSYANTQLKTGDALEVGIPNGRFVCDPKNDLLDFRKNIAIFPYTCTFHNSHVGSDPSSFAYHNIIVNGSERFYHHVFGNFCSRMNVS